MCCVGINLYRFSADLCVFDVAFRRPVVGLIRVVVVINTGLTNIYIYVFYIASLGLSQSHTQRER